MTGRGIKRNNWILYIKTSIQFRVPPPLLKKNFFLYLGNKELVGCIKSSHYTVCQTMVKTVWTPFSSLNVNGWIRGGGGGGGGDATTKAKIAQTLKLRFESSFKIKKWFPDCRWQTIATSKSSKIEVLLVGTEKEAEAGGTKVSTNNIWIIQ